MLTIREAIFLNNLFSREGRLARLVKICKLTPSEMVVCVYKCSGGIYGSYIEGVSDKYFSFSFHFIFLWQSGVELGWSYGFDKNNFSGFGKLGGGFPGATRVPHPVTPVSVFFFFFSFHFFDKNKGNGNK